MWYWYQDNIRNSDHTKHFRTLKTNVIPWHSQRIKCFKITRSIKRLWWETNVVIYPIQDSSRRDGVFEVNNKNNVVPVNTTLLMKESHLGIFPKTKLIWETIGPGFTAKIDLAYSTIAAIRGKIRNKHNCKNWYRYTWSKNDVISSVRKHNCASGLGLG